MNYADETNEFETEDYSYEDIPIRPIHANYAEKPRIAVCGIIGLVCGILAILGSFLPILGVLFIPLTIAALIFGAIALYQSVKGTNQGFKLAIASLVLGGIALLIIVFSDSSILSEMMTSDYWVNGY